MKRFAFLLLAFLAVPLFAEERQLRRTLIDDVIRMTTAGVNDEAIIEFIRKSDERVEVTADDLIALTDAKVSKDVIKAVIDYADGRDGTSRRRYQTRTRDRVVYAPTYWGWGDPFYDPFWYGPHLRFSVGFGGYPYWGRGFYRGGHVFHRGGGFHRRGRR